MTIPEFLNRSSISWLHLDTKQKATNLQNNFWDPYPFPNELHSHGCRDAANERSRPSAIFENSNCTVPVIIITGKPSARSEAFYLESGAVGFFRKPVDGDAVVELIGSVC